jgi:hypothetical protein
MAKPLSIPEFTAEEVQALVTPLLRGKPDLSRLDWSQLAHSLNLVRYQGKRHAARAQRDRELVRAGVAFHRQLRPFVQRIREQAETFPVLRWLQGETLDDHISLADLIDLAELNELLRLLEKQLTPTWPMHTPWEGTARIVWWTSVWIFQALKQPIHQRSTSIFITLNVDLLARLGFKVTPDALAQWIKRNRWTIKSEDN